MLFVTIDDVKEFLLKRLTFIWNEESSSGALPATSLCAHSGGLPWIPLYHLSKRSECVPASPSRSKPLQGLGVGFGKITPTHWLLSLCSLEIQENVADSELLCSASPNSSFSKQMCFYAMRIWEDDYIQVHFLFLNQNQFHVKVSLGSLNYCSNIIKRNKCNWMIFLIEILLIRTNTENK